MIRWVAHDHPLINKQPWSVEEDAMLRNIAKKHKERDWEAIALELKVTETAMQCRLVLTQRARPIEPAGSALSSIAVIYGRSRVDGRWR